MDDMCRLVLLKQLLGLLLVTSVVAQHYNFPAACEYCIPEICFRGPNEDPFLARPLSEARALGLGLNNILDGLADETSSASDQNDRHIVRECKGKRSMKVVEGGSGEAALYASYYYLMRFMGA